MRRVMVIGVFLLACCAPARAALPAHPGRPILPGSPAGSSALRDLRAYPRTLVELDGAASGGARFALSQAGGRLIAPQLSLWRLPSGGAARLLPALQAQGVVRSVTPDVPLRTARASQALSFCTTSDALCPREWWASDVGADRWTPPGPGVPLTMIDSGVDLQHEEFANRPNTTALNPQTYTGMEEDHGTATTSVAAAPANGVGVIGIYPQAKLLLWDASPAGELTVGDEVAGLFAVIKHGPTVINLSLGGFDLIPIEEHAILAAVGAGSLVVASAGNDRDQGSPLSYPASFSHVLTVGATDEADHVTDFSSASSHMDLAAPGQDIPVAAPFPYPNDYASEDGTSFSAPLVSGASAAVWTLRPKLTKTQLLEVMRRSARHLSKRGWNRNTGYGILNVPAALTRKAPAPDPQEPNEDVYLVKPSGLFRAGHAPLTAPGRPNRLLRAHVERDNDPEDVYRAYLPAKGRLVVTVKTSANVTLQVWGKRTSTVFERGAAARRDLLGVSAHAGARSERLVIPGRGVGQYVYLDVFLARPAIETGYTIRVATARR